ncbi:replication restart helicase PriA [Helicobacter vulpis]|uniref:replication restart helicase PriA n=1 Tax=Helicobacter vulpis TaxID=2316076 RepID=UPI000EAD7CFD|nr:primosomal protein N' [Helicobacter vulpis]
MFCTIAPFAKTKPLTYESAHDLTPGAIVKIPLQKRNVLGVVLEECARPDFPCKLATPTSHYFNAHQMLLLRFIAYYYCAQLGVIAPLLRPFKKARASPIPSFPAPKLSPLSPSQQHALLQIRGKPNALLFGDTGSGKTHIYRHLIAQILKEGCALVLIPEIALAPQVYHALLESFEDLVGLWHSKLQSTQKTQLLERLHNQQVRVVVGTRSALFLPIPHLKLVIIDEEHDPSYKSNQAPYYHARDVALYLSSKMPIQVILGSATPSLRSYYMAQSKRRLVRLKGRFFDSHKEILFEAQKSAITPFLYAHLQENLNRHQQSMIFVPTRAHFKKLLCQACGQGVYCPFCSVNMSLHLKDKRMRCHYCQHSTPIPHACPSCQHPLLQGKRMGTQQLKKELEALLPHARIGILDRDHTHTNTQIQHILDALHAQQIDILIGTQMIAKGHDYPKVNLAIILGLDEILYNGSYSSFEQGVSLMHQIAGRSARKERGKVLIQSLNSAFLTRYIEDYEDFLQDELRTRVQLFPPFKRLAQLLFSAPSAPKAQEAMQNVLARIKQALPPDVQILGSGPARVAKIAKRYRYEILLSAHSTSQLLTLLHQLDGSPAQIVMDPLDV